jgi:hypothetical protein
MQSLNFEFLRPKFGEMADLGALAEAYVNSDPPSAAVKLRALAEILTEAIYNRESLPRPIDREFVKLLTNPVFRSSVPSSVLDTLHAMRKVGNEAAHGGKLSRVRAMEMLRDAHRVSHWWSEINRGAKPGAVPLFQNPTKETQVHLTERKREGVFAEAKITPNIPTTPLSHQPLLTQFQSPRKSTQPEIALSKKPFEERPTSQVPAHQRAVTEAELRKMSFFGVMKTLAVTCVQLAKVTTVVGSQMVVEEGRLLASKLAVEARDTLAEARERRGEADALHTSSVSEQDQTLARAQKTSREERVAKFMKI